MRPYPEWFTEFVDFCLMELSISDAEKSLDKLTTKLWHTIVNNFQDIDPYSFYNHLEEVRWKLLLILWKEEIRYREKEGGKPLRISTPQGALAVLIDCNTSGPEYLCETYLDELINLL